MISNLVILKWISDDLSLSNYAFFFFKNYLLPSSSVLTDQLFTKDNSKSINNKDEPIDYSTLAHYSSLIPNVELELFRNSNLAQQLNHSSNAYPIKPSAHYAINFLRNSLANALLPNAANSFQQQTNETQFSILNNAHQPINSINNSTAVTPPVHPNSSKNNYHSSNKDLKQQTNQTNKQTSSYSSGHSIDHQQLINQQTVNHTNTSPTHQLTNNNNSSTHQNRLLHNSTLNASTSPQITPLGYPLSTLAWMSSARGKPRRGMMRRAVFSDAQRQGLEKRFQFQKYISKPDRKKLADDLGLKDSQVKIWFQNRRMKWRKF